MAWVYLLIAGLFEVGWPLGFKLASTMPRYHYLFILLSVLAMGASGAFLFLAQKTIPIGTAYVVWTGIGAVATVLIGILFFHDAVSLARIICLFLIVAGIVGLKLLG